MTLSKEVMLGQVFALSASEQHFFAATTTGLFRSKDAQSWHSLYTSFDSSPTLITTTVAVSPDGNTLIAGVEGGMLRSGDGGSSWQSVPFLAPTPQFTTLANHPEDQGYLIAGTAEDGVFISENDGLSWMPWNFGLLDQHILCLAVSPCFLRDQSVFLGTESGLYVSKNAAKSWLELPFCSDVEPVMSIGISSSFAKDGMVIVGTETNGAFLSQDHGNNWQPLMLTGLPESLALNTINAVQISHTAIRLLLPEAIVTSKDQAKTWSLEHLTDSSALAFLVTDHKLLVGLSEGGVHQYER